jgi:hypothetical protein
VELPDVPRAESLLPPGAGVPAPGVVVPVLPAGPLVPGVF